MRKLATRSASDLAVPDPPKGGANIDMRGDTGDILCGANDGEDEVILLEAIGEGNDIDVEPRCANELDELAILLLKSTLGILPVKSMSHFLPLTRAPSVPKLWGCHDPGGGAKQRDGAPTRTGTDDRPIPPHAIECS